LNLKSTEKRKKNEKIIIRENNAPKRDDPRRSISDYKDSQRSHRDRAHI
jgi:hypothetical protein